MKKLKFVFVTAMFLFSSLSFAAIRTFEAKIEGVVEFKLSYTVTCMAVGCPPSLPYYKIVLNEVKNKEVPIKTIEVESIASAIGVLEKPDSILVAETEIKEGDRVLVNALVGAFDHLGYFYIEKINSIEILK